jgi:galactonate dehydratase
MMRITHLECHLLWVDVTRLNWILTLIRTDDGITGISGVIMRRHEFTVREAILELARYLVGKDPLLREEHFEKMYRDGFWLGGALFNTAISAVDLALWDVAGKSAGLPIHSLLGGACRDRIRVYCGVGGNTPEEAARSAERAVEAGYTAIKTAPLPDSSRFGPHQKETEGLSNAAIRVGARNLAAIRKAVGDDVDIAIDAHGRLSPANAIRVAAALEEYGLLFFEEPVPPESWRALRTVAEGTRIPIATGERIHTIYGARDFVENDAMAIIQADICNTGGYTQYKKIAAMAEAHYIAVAPHNPNGPLPSLQNVQLSAAIPNFLILENVPDWSNPAWVNELLTQPPRLVDGYLAVPNRPGVGTEINEEVLLDLLRMYPAQPSSGTR